MPPSSRNAACGGALLLLAAACSQPAEQVQQRLPDGLSEVSGLAQAGPASVFAHDDERAVIHEIAVDGGRTLRRFALGRPPARGDFEGIAVDGGRIYLIASDGRLLAARPGADGEHVPFEAHDSGVGAYCEVEGLAAGTEPGRLLILCKRQRDGSSGRLLVFAWSPGHPAVPWRDMDLGGALGDAGSFAPSGVEFDPAQGRLIVLSARDRRMLVLDRGGRIAALRRLDPRRHPQAEGIALMADGRLVVADEGQGGAPGRLAVYPAPSAQAGPQ